MNFVSNFFKGIAIGSGAILPGISSGVLCVVFDIYENLLNSVLNFFKDPKKNFKFLFPIMCGCFVGVILLSNFLNYILYAFPIQTKSIFIGLILGSVPSLIKKVNEKEKFKFHYIFYLLFSLAIGFFTVILEKNLAVSSTASNINFLYFVFCGFIMSIGVIVPGVSSTIMLMLLGVYSIYLTSVSSLFLPVLIPIGIGVILGLIVFMKLTQFLLNNFYSQTFYSIIGFTIGSIFVLWPGFSMDFNGLISILCIIVGFLIIN